MWARIFSGSATHRCVIRKVKLSFWYLEGLNGASGCLAALILNLGTRWRFVVSITSRPLCPLWASPQYPMNRSVDMPQIRCGRHGEERNVFTRLGFGRPVLSVVEKPIVPFRFPRLVCTACVLPAKGSGGLAESQDSPISAPYLPEKIRIGLHQQNCPQTDFSRGHRYDSDITKIRILERYNFRWAYHLNATFSWVFSNSFTLKVRICIIKLC